MNHSVLMEFYQFIAANDLCRWHEALVGFKTAEIKCWSIHFGYCIILKPCNVSGSLGQKTTQ